MSALLTADEAARLVPGERLEIVRPGDPQRNAFDLNFITFVAPQAWVALTGPCPTCAGTRRLVDGGFAGYWCDDPDCRDGRRIVPLYRECEVPVEIRHAHSNSTDECEGRVLVGRGSIEAFPVTDVHEFNDGTCIVELGPEWSYKGPFDSLPVPGRDFGIVIDCVEVAP